MADRAFETEGDKVVVRTDGRVQMSPVPEGFSPKAFRHILAAVDVLYRRNGMVPTVNEVCNEWEGFDKKTVSVAFGTPEFAQALSLRGIELDAKAGLTDLQLAALTILQDPTDRSSTRVKLERIGVPMARFRAWQRNPLFSRVLREQAEHNLGDAIPTAINQTVGAVENGEPWAIKQVFEMTGRWNPQQQELQNARTVVLLVMEAIQKHVKDPEVLRSIMDEVEQKTTAISITQSMKELT